MNVQMLKPLYSYPLQDLSVDNAKEKIAKLETTKMVV